MAGFIIWMKQIRANFLVLAILLVAVGLALSYKYFPETSDFNLIHAMLILIGVVSSHISVNLFNEYSDYKSKIDYETERTPFSGGSGILVKGITNPSSVHFAAYLSLFIAAIIGIYFTAVSHWLILVFAIIGAFAIVFYTDFLAKLVLGELFAGLALGTLVVAGTFISMTTTPESIVFEIIPQEVIWLAIPPGLLTTLLLLINEFPDIKADKKGGRRNLAIILGKKRAAYIYTVGMASVFGMIVLLPIFHISSYWLYIALIPLPVAIKACITAIRYRDNNQKFVSALGSNIITVLSTDLLIAISVLISPVQ